MRQGQLFDFEEGTARKEKAIRRVAQRVDPKWLAHARELIVLTARHKEEFTSDDVWQAGLEAPPEPRALGAVMNELARAQVIVQTGRFVKTARKSRHNAPVAVWKLR